MLTDQDRNILDFAAHTYTHPGRRDTDIWTTFGHSPVRHAQIELALIDREDALAYSPLLVSRLRRLRDARVAARAR